jgi:hypothetical protein
MLGIATILLALPAAAQAEIYVPPQNVIDPLKPGVMRLDQSDDALPYIYLEPHDFCYDLAKPLRVTVFAVNRSREKMTVNWPEVVGSLVLEARGPGQAVPRKGADRPRERVEVAPRSVASLTVDLHQLYEVRGESVYRLQYVRPLADGRTHLSSPVQFLVEDDQAINRFVGAIWPDDNHVPARAVVAELLRDNPLFARGGELKTYGWDAMEWRDHQEMHTVTWDKPLRDALAFWRSRLFTLAETEKLEDQVKAWHALTDRLIFLSDGLSAPVDASHPPGSILMRPREQWPREERVRFDLKLARTRAPDIVRASVGRLSATESAEALPLIIRLADGPDKRLAEEALSCLSNYDPHPQIAAFLRRKMTDPDPNLALEAAIIACYSGDGSGFPVLFRHVRHPDPALRLKAVAQLGDASRFRRYAGRVVPELLELLQDEKDPAVLERVIESLGGYPSKQTFDAVAPFLKHLHEQVRTRAQLIIGLIGRELGQEPKPDQ